MFQRLVAIPQEEYLSMSNLRAIQQPLTQHFQTLQKQYSHAEQVRDPYERLLLQSETLDQMKEMKERMRQSLTVSTPKPYQNRAKALFQSMESFLKFNERGELIDETGKVVPSSRVEDLIQHAVRDRRRNMTPLGWTQFRKLLQDHNVPKSLLNRVTLDELEESKPVKSEIPSPRLLRSTKKRKVDTDFLKTF